MAARPWRRHRTPPSLGSGGSHRTSLTRTAGACSRSDAHAVPERLRRRHSPAFRRSPPAGRAEATTAAADEPPARSVPDACTGPEKLPLAKPAPTRRAPTGQRGGTRGTSQFSVGENRDLSAGDARRRRFPACLPRRRVRLSVLRPAWANNGRGGRCSSLGAHDLTNRRHPAAARSCGAGIVPPLDRSRARLLLGALAGPILRALAGGLMPLEWHATP